VTKELFRVAVEGEVWVMAESQQDATREARRAVTMNRDEVDYYVYPMLPIDPNFVDSDILDAIPYGAEDERTVGERLREMALRRASK
jgi:hypothetical protein